MWLNRRLILIFYKPLLILNIAFSLIALKFLSSNGWTLILMSIIIKLVGYAAGTAYQYYFTPNTAFYYRNAGMSLRKLYQYVYILDMLTYGLMLLIYLLFTLI